MIPNDLIARLLQTPFAYGGGDYSGADCWGIVEIWYRETLGISLDDRGEIKPGPDGLEEGFANRSIWCEVKQPYDDDLVIMKAKGLNAGHVGIFYNGLVIHSDEKTGCVAQPINSRMMKPRITCFLRHKDFD